MSSNNSNDPPPHVSSTGEKVVADMKETAKQANDALKGAGEAVFANADAPKNQNSSAGSERSETANAAVEFMSDAAHKTNQSIKEFTDDVMPNVHGSGAKSSNSDGGGSNNTRAPTGEDVANYVSSTVEKIGQKINPQSQSNDKK